MGGIWGPKSTNWRTRFTPKSWDGRSWVTSRARIGWQTAPEHWIRTHPTPWCSTSPAFPNWSKSYERSRTTHSKKRSIWKSCRRFKSGSSKGEHEVREEEKVEQQIREILDTESHVIPLSNKLFS